MEEKLLKLESFINVVFKSDVELEPLRCMVEDELELSELTEMLSVIFEKDNALRVLRCIFFGLTQKVLSQEKRLVIIERMIAEWEIRNRSYDKVADLQNIVLPELDKFRTACLVRLIVVCLDAIRDSSKSKNTSWKEILPKILTLLQNKQEVPYNGSTLSFTEFKREIIRAICRANISPDIATLLASTFVEILMTTDECREMVEKLCGMFSVIEAKELPELVKQLLYLCKGDHVVFLFLQLGRHFTQILPSNMNSDEPKTREFGVAQLKILTYVEEFARISRLNDFIKFCKNASNCSCLLLDPFLLAILLILSCIPAYEAQVRAGFLCSEYLDNLMDLEEVIRRKLLFEVCYPITELLKTLITQAVSEEERKKESAWLCLIIDHNFDVDQLFSTIIQSSLCDHEQVVEGLINLSFLLLTVSGAGVKYKESSVKKIWRIGRIVLVSLVKKHARITKSVLQSLTDRIITGCVSQQYTDCLLHLCNVASVTMIDNAPIVTRVLEFIDSMPGIVSQRIVVALIPLVQISTSLRDNLILYLRKALFSRNMEIRQTSVLGFLQLLKFLKLQRVSALSQNTLTQTTFIGSSVFTQICMDIHTQQTSSQQLRPSMNPNINEAICLEVIGILKRCFMQQVSVKITLYKGLSVAIYANPQLYTVVLDVLLDHFSQFYENDANVLPPIRLEKTIDIKNTEILLLEPIGHFLLLVQDVLTNVQLISVSMEDSDSDSTRSFNKFISIFDSLVVRFSLCDSHHFKLDETISLADSNCDGIKVREIIEQNMVQISGVYEALLAYVINTWNRQATTETSQKLIALDEAYRRIIDSVNLEKITKKKDKEMTKKSSTNDETVLVVESMNHNSVKMDKNCLKKKVFKIPIISFNLKTVNRLLSMFLLDDVEWSSVEATKEIKSQRQLFRYAVNCALEVTRRIKLHLSSEQRSSAVFNDVVSLARLIFFQCLLRYNTIFELDKTAAANSVQCFSEMVSLILLHYKSKFSQFLEESILVEAADGLPQQLLPILKVYKNLLKTALVFNGEKEKQTHDGGENFEHTNKILTPILIHAINTVLSALPSEHSITSKILDWLISIAEKHIFGTQQNSNALLHIVCTMLRRCRSDLTVLDSVSVQLCNLFPSINELTRENTIQPFKMITKDNMDSVLSMTCSSLICHLDDAEYMISRFKSEDTIVSYLKNNYNDSSTQYNILKRREKELCQHVTHITLMAENLISIAAPTGSCLELILKFLTRTFSILTALTKYFICRSTETDPVYQSALFQKLVKIAGSQFIRQEASELILYVEKDYENENEKSLNHLNNQAKKQLILLPKLIVELESFPKTVMKLSKKCKDMSLLNNVKLTITRDFRLNIQMVGELIDQQNKCSSDDEEYEENGDSLLELSSSRLSSTEPLQKRIRIS